MTWFKRLFNRIVTAAAATAQPDGEVTPNIFEGLEGIRLGRYSDNNKTNKKAQNWYQAETLFKEKKYAEAFSAFFSYLLDEQEQNVVYNQGEGEAFEFELVQGSKKVTGYCRGGIIQAMVPLATMEVENLAVMRRLLDMNFTLQYTRSAMQDDGTLCMIFDTDISSASPDKMYYGLRELATRADKMDDLLLAEFSRLGHAGGYFTQPLPQQELDIKYRYFHQWIGNILHLADAQNQDSFSGAIAYLMAALVYRIDFLIVPESKMLADLERISDIYWAKKEEMTLVERNLMMRAAIDKLAALTRDGFRANVYRSKSTFAISTPPRLDKVRDNIYNANRDSKWYAENLHLEIALIIVEYGLMYNQFIYSLPSVMHSLALIFMSVVHVDFFSELGMKELLYQKEGNVFRTNEIERAVDQALSPFRDKFRKMKWDHGRISYSSLYDFAITFSEQIANLNLETRR